LTVKPSYFSHIIDTICVGDTYYFHTKPLTSAGTYTDTLKTAHGCDSIIVLTLHVNPTYTIPQTETICGGDTAYFHNKPLTLADTYRDTLKTVNGCDSIIELTLTVFPEIPVTYYSATFKQGETYSDVHFTNLTDTGEHCKTLQSVDGCDSIVCLILTYDYTGIVETARAPSLRIYPNPARDQLTIAAGQAYPALTQVELFDIYGRKLYTSPLPSPKERERSPLSEGLGEVFIDISHLATGIYVLKIQTDSGVVVRKVVKE
jgi:hypothetical protein